MEKYNLETELIMYNDSSVKTLSIINKANSLCSRMHWHERIEFLRIIKGTAKIDFGNTSFSVAENQVVIVPPRKAHSIFALTDIEYISVAFDIRNFYNKTTGANKLLANIYEGNIVFNQFTNSKKIIEIIDYIYTNCSKSQNAFAVIAAVYNLLYELSNSCVLSILPHGNIDKSILSITEYIDENFFEEITVADLSIKSGYTQPYFCKKFKETTGLTPINYIKTVRFEKAFEMIKSGNIDINDLTYKCGFSEPNYFTRCFKAHFGFPPSHLIKNRILI